MGLPSRRLLRWSVQVRERKHNSLHFSPRSCILFNALLMYCRVDLFSFAPLSGVTVFNSLRFTRTFQGATVGVNGLGGLGHLGIQVRSFLETSSRSECGHSGSHLMQVGSRLVHARGHGPFTRGLLPAGTAFPVSESSPFLTPPRVSLLSQSDSFCESLTCHLTCPPSRSPFSSPPLSSCQFAAKMGYRVFAFSRGTAKEADARQFGAHEYFDTTEEGFVEKVQVREADPVGEEGGLEGGED